MNSYLPDPSSYRDPAGFVFSDKGIVYRQINKAGKADFEQFVSSELYNTLLHKKLIVEHEVIASKKLNSYGKNAWQIIKPSQIPFVSYPYEWSFDQLKDAALLTLKIQQIALKHGMILKDASAYNVQFIGKNPIFIDTLSFTKYQSGQGWEGYKQFCEHFLAPLAISHYTSVESQKMLTAYPEGLPLSLVTKLLPTRARYKKGLGAHLFLHATSQRRHQNKTTSNQSPKKVSEFALQGLLHSLGKSINSLHPPKLSSEWEKYYEFTNYSDEAFKNKQAIISALLDKIGSASMVWDLGANNGAFSSLAAERGSYTVAWDIDSNAVNANYRQKRLETDGLILPLVQDIATPSPALGWSNSERKSFSERAPADILLALALIHHLAIGRNVPFEQIASFLSKLGTYLIIEFVPKSDSKVKHLLSSRKDIFPYYDQAHFEKAFGQYFKLIHRQAVAESERSIYLYKRV